MPFDIDEIYHADWSVGAKGRWKVHARRINDGNNGWCIDDMSPVGDIAPFINQLCQDGQTKTIWLGLDFPLGLCRAWYEKSGFENFASVQDWLSTPQGQGFFDICDDQSQITPNRPFYPARAGAKGSVKRAHLASGLGVDAFSNLHRTCEKATSTRNEAAVPFWTLGANQVGKAMLHGWQNLLLPGRDCGFHIWPFDGDLARLSQTPGTTLIETYPAEIYGWLGLHEMTLPSGRFAKSRQDARRDAIAHLMPMLESWGIVMEPSLYQRIANGIDNAHGKDDAFDALIGVIGLIMIAMGKRAENLSDTAMIRDQEGWIIGQFANLPAS